MKKKITIVVLFGVVLLCLYVMFPIKNKHIEIRDLNYATLLERILQENS